MVIDRHQQRLSTTLSSKWDNRIVALELHNIYVPVCKEGRKLVGIPFQTELCISTK